MEGYAKVAQLMSRHEDFAILRRFRALNMQNLLYMQAEITFLEEELATLVNRDAADPEKKYYGRDWWSLSQSDEDVDKAQWHKFFEIRAKLKEYSPYSCLF